jgi:hypothetical protein
MTFHIGSQHAGVVNNVGGDQTVYGGQHATTHLPALVTDLQGALEGVPLPPDVRAEARAQVDEIAREGGLPTPDRARIAAGLERLTRTLASAGALARAGAALRDPLVGLAHWLGALGNPVLQLLGT